MYKQPNNVYTMRDFSYHLRKKKPNEEMKKQEEEKKQIGRELIKQDVKKQFQANTKI
jgi:hypothetical protein